MFRLKMKQIIISIIKNNIMVGGHYKFKFYPIYYRTKSNFQERASLFIKKQRQKEVA